MNEIYVIDANRCYMEAERKANEYFSLLKDQILEQTYVQTLTEDIQKWKKNHVHTGVLSYIGGRKDTRSNLDYRQYIHWLENKGKLKDYLERSVSYIFLRDLGRTLNSKATQKRITHIVNNLIEQMKNPKDHKDEIAELFSFKGMYRKAQKEKVETTMIWLFEKLQNVTKNLPEEMDALNARRKLIKIIAGVMMHVNEEMDESYAEDKRVQKFENAIRLGYSYGLTYPFVDDLLDSNVLNADEKDRYSNIIRETLLTGRVPDFGEEWQEKNQKLMQYIHSELKEAFIYMKDCQQEQSKFYEQSYVFFHSQEVDRNKDLSYSHYSNENLFIPVILKSSSSRLIARTMVNVEEDEGFEERTFFYGIYNQLADDFADMFIDEKEGAVTPYTYFLKHHQTRSDLINPFEMYWTVIYNLIHHVYHSDEKTREVILDRAINGLKRFKEKHGTETFENVMSIFALRNSKIQKLIIQMINKADDVDFYDKLLRDQMLTSFKNEKEELEQFSNTIKEVQTKINNKLKIDSESNLSVKESVIDAANYSLDSGGKRLRPIITWFMGVKIYGLNEADLFPLLKSLEYMHTASLIFDDLPSQDDASTRRGHPTVHQIYNVATAELAGLYLTQKAFEEQASMEKFDAKSVLKLIQYAAKMTAEMCQGQAMDLASKGRTLSLIELNTISFYKTGLGFEASLIMPAILAQATEGEIEALKKFAKHAGIAFQIKDDLLDVEGDSQLLGKKIGIDALNNNSTFVSILGIDGAKKEMWEHYCQAMDSIENIPRNTTFLKHFLNYIVHREK
ncbi:polyprenyl synthetase family protein [Ureibacillus manganicus]|uniref:Geranyl transferase n=1 Tax=Ureibacillus manganicus DSM 26584 TaxID=1384049 RepID=A0A0A3I3E8_9BACL|nr:polyprenyl synthetase family protein [Ureibacillus manganicus]KGR79249.1 geranyl transferase [Ureibacillus manganicus DSM 26584]